MATNDLIVAPRTVTDGSPVVGARGSRDGATVTQDAHGRFYEQTSRGNVFSNGTTITALSANTISLTSTTTPILGVWNPTGSGKNLVILQASLSCAANNLTAPVPPGTFVWAVSTGNGAISTGSNPLNHLTLTTAGSVAKGMSFVALTGLTNNLVIQHGADLPNLSALTNAGTITAQTTTSNATLGVNGTQNFDGGLIVPPGGVLALLNVNSTTTYSASGRIMWEEVSITQ